MLRLKTTIIFLFLFQLVLKGQNEDSLNCSRSTPSPLLVSRKCNSWIFKLKAKNKEGIEHAKLFNGDSVSILHKGCEFYELEFKYFFRYPKLDKNNQRDWSVKLIEALEQLRLSGLEIINLKKYQEKLTNKIGEKGFLEENIPYDTEDFVVKERIFIEKQGEELEFQFIEFSIFIGPL